MSIVVIVRVGEGLVMATDSASTLSATSPDGTQSGVVKIFNNATKLMQVCDYPMGVATWGVGNIGPRTITSLIEEFSNTRLSLEKIVETKPKGLNIKTETKALMKHLVKFYTETYPDWNPEQPHSSLGVLVSGFSGKAYFPEEYVFNVPEKEFVELRKPRENDKQDFGANWFGEVDAITRLHHGCDNQLPRILEAHCVDTKTIETVVKQFQDEVQYKVPFDGMPLQDAVNYAMYLVGVVIGRFRFAVGPEICGGPIDVATISRQEGFKWIKQKRLMAKEYGPTSTQA